MINKKTLIIIGTLLVLAILPMIFAQAAPWPAFNVCCERTTNGAWCQNTLRENCDESLRVTPTACEGTSFCKPGICFDSSEGLCMDNTPQKVCNDANGTWINDELEDAPQCNLGCCVLGTQASFVTLTRCKKLSGFYGLQTDFRTNIASELSCIAVAASQDEGACVFESDFQRTCKFTTRGECTGIEEGGNRTSAGEFFKDYLCSAEELATNCGPSSDTICIPGKDGVYYKDTCGNPANIYDANKRDDKSYWKTRIDRSNSCGYGSSNAGSSSCGNCDYFQGSVCSEGSASYGDYICTDLNCYDTQNGEDYKNGESWCEYQGEIGDGKDTVGSRQFRHVCINGRETIEPCADFRNEVCISGVINSGGSVFREAACRVNRWRDCIDQDEEEDCLNQDRRNCFWLEGTQFTGLASEEESTAATREEVKEAFPEGTNTFTGNVVAPITGNFIGSLVGGDDEDEVVEEPSGVQLGGNACLPNSPPGLKFWSEGDASNLCSLGDSRCVIEFEVGLLEKWGDELDDFEDDVEEGNYQAAYDKCEGDFDGKNCECLLESYAQSMNRVCTSLGDCGAYVNVAGKFTADGAEWKLSESKQTLTQSIMIN